MDGWVVRGIVGRGSWVMGRGSCVLLVGLASYVVDGRSLVALCGLCVLGSTPGHRILTKQ